MAGETISSQIQVTPQSGDLFIIARGANNRNIDWSDIASQFMPNVLNAEGQLVIGGAGGAPEALSPSVDGYRLEQVSGRPAWVPAALGEVNTASSVGGGVEVFKQKSLLDFEHRTLTSLDTSIAFTQNADTIDLSVATPSTAGRILEETIVKSGTDVNVEFAHTLQAGNDYYIEAQDWSYVSGQATLVLDQEESAAWTGSTAWTYTVAFDDCRGTSVLGSASGGAGEAFLVGSNAVQVDAFIDLWVKRPADAVKTVYRSLAYGSLSGTTGYGQGQAGGYRNGTVAATRLRLRSVGTGFGNIRGTFKLWRIPQ